MLLPDCGFQAEHTLLEVGLAFEERNRVRTLAPVRESVARRYPPRADDRDRAIKHYVLLAVKCRAEGVEAVEHITVGAEVVEHVTAEFANLEEMLLQGLQQADPMPSVEAALSVAGLILHSGKGTERVLEQAYEVAKRLGQDLSRADCCRCLGHISRLRTYYARGRVVRRGLGPI